MEYLGLELGLFLFATFKYLFAALIAVASDIPLWQGFFIVTSGGIVGITIFTYFSELVMRVIGKWIPNKKRISKMKRFMVKVKRGWGLVGIAFLSPIVLSLPVGCLVSKTFESNNLKIVFILSLGVIFWSSVFFGGKYFFGIGYGEYR